MCAFVYVCMCGVHVFVMCYSSEFSIKLYTECTKLLIAHVKHTPAGINSMAQAVQPSRTKANRMWEEDVLSSYHNTPFLHILTIKLARH